MTDVKTEYTDDGFHQIEVDVHMPSRRVTADWEGVYALYFTRAQVVELIHALAQSLEVGR